MEHTCIHIFQRIKRVLINTREHFVDIMCQVNPEYEKYVRYENGKKVLYLLLLRVIYGCIESALLWYNIFYTTLEGLVFERNPCDRCVAKKVIEGTQCTIDWYVYDNRNPEVISDIINEVKKCFGEFFVVRGKNYNF